MRVSVKEEVIEGNVAIFPLSCLSLPRPKAGKSLNRKPTNPLPISSIEVPFGGYLIRF